MTLAYPFTPPTHGLALTVPKGTLTKRRHLPHTRHSRMRPRSAISRPPHLLCAAQRRVAARTGQTACPSLGTGKSHWPPRTSNDRMRPCTHCRPSLRSQTLQSIPCQLTPTCNHQGLGSRFQASAVTKEAALTADLCSKSLGPLCGTRSFCEASMQIILSPHVINRCAATGSKECIF